MEKIILLSLCLTTIFFSQCTSFAINGSTVHIENVRDEQDKHEISPWIIDQAADSSKKGCSSICKMGSFYKTCYPKKCRKVMGFRITFSSPFSKRPKVSVSINGFDFNRLRSSRLRVGGTQVTQKDFIIWMYMWSDTILWGAGASWIACEDTC